jgi:hypothetical protein
MQVQVSRPLGGLCGSKVAVCHYFEKALITDRSLLAYCVHILYTTLTRVERRLSNLMR